MTMHTVELGVVSSTWEALHIY